MTNSSNRLVMCRREVVGLMAATFGVSLLPFHDALAQTTPGLSFPAAGHRYLVNFVAFRVELFFRSMTSLTYTGIAPDGTHGASETVTIRVEAIADNVFLVTWQESDKTTVVHIENYQKRTIITNITNRDNSFEQYHGTFVMLS